MVSPRSVKIEWLNKNKWILLSSNSVCIPEYYPCNVMKSMANFKWINCCQWCVLRSTWAEQAMLDLHVRLLFLGILFHCLPRSRLVWTLRQESLNMYNLSQSNSIFEFGSVQTSLARFIVFQATSLFRKDIPFSSHFPFLPSQAALLFE